MFDRFVALAGGVANAGFLIYLADSAGYTGSVGLLLVKHFYAADISCLNFFVSAVYSTAIIGGALVTLSWLYFRWRFFRTERQPQKQPLASVPAARLN